MREILFRGKNVKTGEWEIGWYVKAPFDSWPLRDCIIPMDRAEAGEYIRVEVDPETVGQFTGLLHPNRGMIFEGDVIRTVSLDMKPYHGVIRFGRYNSPFHEEETNVGFFVEWLPEYPWRRDLAYWIGRDDIDVIGNIYDNPELLEVE